MGRTSAGWQFWNAGQHFRSVEFALFPAYLKQLQAIDDGVAALKRLPWNVTCHFLPPPAVAVLRQLFRQAKTRSLTPLPLESALLQCVGELTAALRRGVFDGLQDAAPSVHLGKRRLTLGTLDLLAVQQTRQILADHLSDPPTIACLSKQVFLNEQKPKAGFAYRYQMTIGQFLRGQRMSQADALLASSSLSVREIVLVAGYASCSGFIKAFRETYQKTPWAFRQGQNDALRKTAAGQFYPLSLHPAPPLSR